MWRASGFTIQFHSQAIPAEVKAATCLNTDHWISNSVGLGYIQEFACQNFPDEAEAIECEPYFGNILCERTMIRVWCKAACLLASDHMILF